MQSNDIDYLFGDRKAYHESYYKLHRDEILQNKKQNRPQSYGKCFKVNVQCDMNCDNCIYEDCIMPIYDNTNEYMKLWKKANKEKVSAWNNAYYEENKERILQKLKEHRKKPEVVKARAEYDKKWRLANPDKVREKSKRYYEKHKDEINAKKKLKRQQQKEVRKYA